MSKTAKAMTLLKQNPGMSIYAAAKACDLDYSVLHRALKKRDTDTRPRCPTCDQVTEHVLPVEAAKAPAPTSTLDELRAMAKAKGWPAVQALIAKEVK